MQTLSVIGIDLSGPRNITDTAVAIFEQRGDALNFVQAIHAAGDRQIYDLVPDTGKKGRVVVGVDAPLSYNPGGGDRPSDMELRQLVLKRGRVGVMPPTLIRMVYLTLRGIAVTRMLESLRQQMDIQIVEVHPGAAMLLRGAPAADVSSFKRDGAARVRLLDWLEEMGLRELPRDEHASEHFVAACAAVLAAWQWSKGAAAWCYPARPPEHPYDFAC